MTAISPSAPAVHIVGGGPAGLMAAETLAAAGRPVVLHDAMPSVGRKFLLAGKGGLNLTHSEPRPGFDARYGERAAAVAPWLDAFSPQALRDWAAGLGVATFVGSSGRVFPAEMKAAPLLRAWVQRLRQQGVVFRMRERWLGFDPLPLAEGAPSTTSAPSAPSAHDPAAPPPLRLRLAGPEGPHTLPAAACVLALGGASWSRLGSDGAWVAPLAAAGVPIAPLRPANVGFHVGWAGQPPGWSAPLRARQAGAPIKPVRLSMALPDGRRFERAGEFVLSDYGVEGSLIYAAGAPIREQIAATGACTVHLDLLPAFSLDKVRAEIAHPRGPRSLATHLKSRLGLEGAKAALLQEVLHRGLPDTPATRPDPADAAALAALLKAWPLRLVAPRPIDEAISTAGGVALEALGPGLMLPPGPALPAGVFVAGEMLDWEAPTGGYLLQACLASGRCAGQGVLRWLGAAPA